MDISMPGLNGFQTAAELKRVGSPAKIVFLTMHHEDEFVAQAVRSGAMGYVVKTSAWSDLSPALRHALEGRRSLPLLTPLVMIRVGVTYNHTHYFVDEGSQRGLTFAYLKRFEDQLNTARRTRNFRIHVVVVPMARDRLLPALTAGQIDAVAAQWTVTPERQQVVDFSFPYRTKVNEIVVTAPGVPAVGSVQELSGREVFVRRSSSYAESLRALNQQLANDGRPPVTILDAPETLEDDDILDMGRYGNSGLANCWLVKHLFFEGGIYACAQN